MKNLSSLLLLSSFIALLLVACGANTAASEDGKLRVVTTTGQVGDAVANIAGDTVELKSLLGPGIDPHLYVPTEGDVSSFANADVIFYNGLHLEAQMTRVLDQMAERGTIVVAMGESMPEDQLLSWDTSTYDPHVWNDPILWSLGVAAIRDTLIEADPDNAETYRINAETYLADIAETHEFVQTEIAKIPEDKRVMITAHDAFGYFARTYGMEVRGLQGISTESEAGTQDVQELAAFIVERQIPAIFVESSVPPDTIEAVQEAVRAQGFEVEIGGQLFSDALGEAGHEADNYNGMLRHNATTLANALGQ